MGAFLFFFVVRQQSIASFKLFGLFSLASHLSSGRRHVWGLPNDTECPYSDCPPHPLQLVLQLCFWCCLCLWCVLHCRLTGALPFSLLTSAPRAPHMGEANKNSVEPPEEPTDADDCCWSSDDDVPQLRQSSKPVHPNGIPMLLPSSGWSSFGLQLTQQHGQKRSLRVCPDTDPLHKRGKLRPHAAGVAAGWERTARLESERKEPTPGEWWHGTAYSCDSCRFGGCE